MHRTIINIKLDKILLHELVKIYFTIEFLFESQIRICPLNLQPDDDTTLPYS